MASPKIAEVLSQLQSDIPSSLESLLSNLKTLSTPETISADLHAIANAILSTTSHLGVVTQRTLIERLIVAVRTFEQPDLWIDIGEHLLNTLSSSTSSASTSDQTTTSGTFLEQIVQLRELLADAHEANEDHILAARALAEIPLDSSSRRVTEENRVSVWVRIVRNYLEVDDTTTAETYLNKLKNVIYQVSDPTLNLHFKLSQARIQDSKREFLSASQAYHDISLSAAISEDERLHTLGMAVKCAILAPAGPLRSRALGRLFKDERAAGLPEFGMLEKMLFDRLLAPDEVRKFAEGLAPHQLALTADGTTVLARAVVEHNLLGVSRLYNNIGFDDLGVLLGLDADKAEDTTAKMIEQGRLVGSIDQIDRVIWFEGGEASGVKGSGRAEVKVGREMRRWDANVQSLAEAVENVTNALQREFPEFVHDNLVVG
ncbi:uncharacterized protein GGS22DRAFT_168956 [Annulohypoxylon maeteangense]|uniref:uncharacterized protein n=1 Tax=Annulohypoxylon maeteangense TaxID=1927788 RepID=UPI002008A5C2|nr:uncharacterized protein GGS22DRAFT_168956 [Annulohypoxylon maeteangense]KAI0882857.1 hypothetical protein GGS22DRAFT_168956 [Annulohypoxylon maeteangense]